MQRLYRLWPQSLHFKLQTQNGKTLNQTLSIKVQKLMTNRSVNQFNVCPVPGGHRCKIIYFLLCYIHVHLTLLQQVTDFLILSNHKWIKRGFAHSSFTLHVISGFVQSMISLFSFYCLSLNPDQWCHCFKGQILHIILLFVVNGDKMTTSLIQHHHLEVSCCPTAMISLILLFSDTFKAPIEI